MTTALSHIRYLISDFAAVLHFYEGYTKEETAEIIGSTASAVGVHLDRAKKRLRDLLGDDDD